VTYLAYKAELTDQEPCPVAVGTQRVATAGEEGITEWVAADVTAKPIGRRLYEVTIKATLGIRDWSERCAILCHAKVKFRAGTDKYYIVNT